MTIAEVGVSRLRLSRLDGAEEGSGFPLEWNRGIGDHRLSDEAPSKSPRKARDMQSYPVDIEPEQLIRWIIAEREKAASQFVTVASCVKETRDIPLKKELRLGEEAREDVSEIVTLATLKITPARPNDGWSLSVVVEDDLGPSVSEEDVEAEEGEEEEIDIDTFYNEFIVPGRGSANVVAEVKNAVAKQHLSRLLADIVRDRHAKNGGALRETS